MAALLDTSWWWLRSFVFTFGRETGKKFSFGGCMPRGRQFSRSGRSSSFGAKWTLHWRIHLFAFDLDLSFYFVASDPCKPGGLTPGVGRGKTNRCKRICVTVDVVIGNCEAMVMSLFLWFELFAQTFVFSCFPVVLGSALGSWSSYAMLLLKVASDFNLTGWQLCWTQVGDGCCGLASLLVARQPRNFLSRAHVLETHNLAEKVVPVVRSKNGQRAVSVVFSLVECLSFWRIIHRRFGGLSKLMLCVDECLFDERIMKDWSATNATPLPTGERYVRNVM